MFSWLGGGVQRILRRKKLLRHTLNDISSIENLLAAWREFEPGKRSKRDVQDFSVRLIDNLFELQETLRNGTYTHGPYEQFTVNDPKTRTIHKASVRDRILHRAIYRLLYPFFDATFISDSYSCRLSKGTHRAIAKFMCASRKVSRNQTHTVWVLKVDVRKFFASINHNILLDLLRIEAFDQKLMALLEGIVRSFSVRPGQGLPLGNLTSQLFSNIYLNQLDQFVKHGLKVEHYIRYADDFVLLSRDLGSLENLIEPLRAFLSDILGLDIHPDKIWIKSLASGADFLGWVHFPHHRVLRASTKRRIVRSILTATSEKSLQSYLGLLKHGNAFELQQNIIGYLRER